MTTPDSSQEVGAEDANAPARSDAIELGVVGGDVADPTRRGDTGDDGTSHDPEDVVEGTATSRKLGGMTAPERLRRIDGDADGGRFVWTFRLPNVAGSARARLPPGRARAPSRVPRGVREVHTASFPPVPLGGHAPKAPTASRVVIGRESLRRQKVAAPDCAARAAPSRSIKLRTRNHHQRETVCLCEKLRDPHCHAREASAPHAHRRHDDHPVLRGPPGYGGPAGVLRACPHRTRAPRRASSSRTFSVHAACEASSPADRRPFVPRVPRARTR
jgi:hypothetical protein